MQKTEEKKDIKSTSTSLIEDMFHAGAHFGYSKTRRHPSFKPMVFGAKKGVDILNLEKTGAQLMKTLELVAESAKLGKNFLLVGTKHEARKAVEEAARTLELPYVTKRWIGGTLTNFPEIKKRVARLTTLVEQKKEGKLDVYTKKERLLLDREIARLETFFRGIVKMEKTPDMLFIIDPRHEKTAVKEAIQKSIPIVALASSDCNLADIQYPIPANDSSMTSIIFFMNKFVKAYQEGKKQQTAPAIAEKVKENKEKNLKS
ncbi:MAG: 30S ribosomal protein S2 [Parcubacteria group bacterium]|nr:30S ribosomal protein S2 [Parcubacteria group bacterium]